MKLAIIALPWHLGKRSTAMGAGPEAILKSGLVEQLQQLGHEAAGPWSAELTEAEQKEYGAWHKVGLANRHLADLVHKARSEGYFPLILESDCVSALGVLAGLQRSIETATKLGMLWFDAHGDANTPETTLSGHLFGMPVAIAAGLCLHRLRQKAGLEPPLSPKSIVLLGVRDLDPLEKELVEENGIETLSTEDVARADERFQKALGRIAEATDTTYVHIDLDVLDPQDFPASQFPVPNGLRTQQLIQALDTILSYPKIAAVGFSSLFQPFYEVEHDVEGKGLATAVELIRSTATKLGDAARSPA